MSASAPTSVEDLSTAEAAALAELVWRMTPGPKTLRDIADRVGLSTERVRIIEREALTKLRKRMANDACGLHASDDKQTTQTIRVINARMQLTR